MRGRDIAHALGLIHLAVGHVYIAAPFDALEAGRFGQRGNLLGGHLSKTDGAEAGKNHLASFFVFSTELTAEDDKTKFSSLHSLQPLRFKFLSLSFGLINA